MTASSGDQWKRASELFNELADLDTGERQRRLSSVDPDIRTTVESLLAADAVADEDLQRFEAGVSSVVRRNTAHQLDPADPLHLIGIAFSHFRVLDYVASGGMGVVYRAEDTQLKRIIALKFPLPHHQLNKGMKDRFIREAQSAGALEHVNLCSVHEVGDSEYGPFIAMPFYPGKTLKQRLEESRDFAVSESLEIARQVATGLAYAHGAGIIHRDLKPGNVMILPDGMVKILDFGLAKAGDITQTRSGITLGTVSYMAPEQIRGDKVDARADLWSLGVLLYEMFTGTRPFAGEHEVSIAHAILHHDPKPPVKLRADLPRPAAALVLSLLEKNPGHRYASANDVVNDLDAVKSGIAPTFRLSARSRTAKWIRRHRIPLAASAVIVIGGIAAAAPRLSSALNKPTKNPEAYQYYVHGRDNEQHGSMAAAESLYHRALGLDSGFALARARLAVVYAQCQPGGSRDCYIGNVENRRLNRLEQIRLEAEKALRQKPGLADAHFALGLYWEQREEPARALAEFRLARRGLRNAGEVYAAIGRSYRSQGRWQNAIEEFDRAISLDPLDAESMADLATTYSRLRRYEESVRLWDRYLTLRSTAYRAMMIKGNVFLRWQGTVDSLAAIFNQLPPRWQQGSYRTHVLIARIRQNPAEALAALDSAPPQVPDDSVGFESRNLLRADVYHDMGDSIHARMYYDSARIRLEKVASGMPNNFRVHAALGLAYAGLGRDTDAVREANRTMSLMPASRAMVAGTTAMRDAAEIYARMPAYHSRAINLLDSLLKMPAGREVSTAFLRVDPAWTPLRSNPQFQQLIARPSN